MPAKEDGAFSSCYYEFIIHFLESTDSCEKVKVMEQQRGDGVFC